MLITSLNQDEDFKVGVIEKDDISSLSITLTVPAIVIVNKGKCTFDVNEQEYSLHKNSVILFFPEDAILMKKVSDDYRSTVILMSQRLFGDTISRLEYYILDAFYITRWVTESPSVDSHRFFLNIVDNLNFIYTQKDGVFKYEQVLGQLNTLFYFCADCVRVIVKNQETPKFSRIESHFRRFMQILAQEYKKSREVSYITEKLNLTPKYLNYICNEVAHSTCKSLIDKFIIMKLKNELRTTHKSIQEIAYEYNFPNQSFLGCYFKKFTGVSPRKYRNGETFTHDQNKE